MLPVTKDPTSSERWNVDQLFQYLTRVAGWPEGAAIVEMQEKFKKEQLLLHWHRTDPEGMGQEGDVPGASFFELKLCVARDFNSDKKHGPIDFATGEVTAGNDGRVFIQALQASIPATYELTVSAWLARSLWPPRLMSEAPVATSAERIQPTALPEPQSTSTESAPSEPALAARDPGDDDAVPTTKEGRVISLLADLDREDKEGRFKPGMKGANIETIVRPLYKLKFGADVPSRTTIWRAYRKYRKTHPLS
jgi:hypothetical protein